MKFMLRCPVLSSIQSLQNTVHKHLVASIVASGIIFIAFIDRTEVEVSESKASYSDLTTYILISPPMHAGGVQCIRCRPPLFPPLHSVMAAIRMCGHLTANVAVTAQFKGDLLSQGLPLCHRMGYVGWPCLICGGLPVVFLITCSHSSVALWNSHWGGWYCEPVFLRAVWIPTLVSYTHTAFPHHLLSITQPLIH